MDIKTKINEKLQRLQDLNREMKGISDKIGALQEQGRALHSAALEIKGAIDGLAELEAAQTEELKTSETAKLTLPVGVKPILPEAPKGETVVVSADGTVAPATDKNTETSPKLEVVQ